MCALAVGTPYRSPPLVSPLYTLPLVVLPVQRLLRVIAAGGANQLKAIPRRCPQQAIACCANARSSSFN